MNEIETYSTKELIDELKTRLGVEALVVEHSSKIEVPSASIVLIIEE